MSQNRSAKQDIAPDSGEERSDSVVVRRSKRIEAKLLVARQILSELSDNHPRRRVLHAAIVRRDEVLLDGLIHELG